MHALSTTHPMSKITRSAISRKPMNQKKKKKIVLENIFLQLYTHFGAKIQNTSGRKSWMNFFDICKILHESAKKVVLDFDGL